MLLNAIRNSPSPLSAESDHYSQIDGSESVHDAVTHPSHVEDQITSQHYPSHDQDVSLSVDAAIDPTSSRDAVAQPVQEQDHVSYHAIPEQSDMQELGDRYLDNHEDSAGQEEAGDYVIEEAYSESGPSHQDQLENGQEQGYTAEAAQQGIDQRTDGYLHPDGLNGLSNGTNTEQHYPPNYPEDPKQDESHDLAERETGRDLAIESEINALRSAFTGPSERNDKADSPRDATSNAFRGLLEASRMLGSTSGQQSTTSTNTKYQASNDDAANDPTELERALRSFAIPANRMEQDQRARATTNVRRQTSAVSRTENGISYTGSSAARTSRKLSLPLSSQVIPQKRKARSELSPDEILARISSPESGARPSRSKSGATAQPVPSTPAVHVRGRATTPPFLEEMRRTKISRMFAATTGPGGSRIPEQQMSFSTITLLHGHIVQKSYLKEKR